MRSGQSVGASTGHCQFCNRTGYRLEAMAESEPISDKPRTLTTQIARVGALAFSAACYADGQLSSGTTLMG
jgi:hypothetical protein